MRYLTIFICFVLVICNFISTNAQSHKVNSSFAIYRVKDNWATQRDTLSARYFENTLLNGPGENGYREIKAVMSKDSFFTFKIPVTKQSGSFYIARILKKDSIPRDNPNLTYLPISDMIVPMVTDNINMLITEFKDPFLHFPTYRLKYSGLNCKRLQVKEDLKTIDKNLKVTAIFDSNYNYIHDNTNQISLTDKIQYINEHATDLTKLEIEELKANVIYGDLSVMGWVEFYGRKLTMEDSSSYFIHKRTFQSQYNKYLNGIPDFQLSTEALLRSRLYVIYILKKLSRCDFVMNHISKDSLYDYLKTNFSGEIRDQLLTTFFLAPELTDGASNIKDVRDALLIVKSAYCRKALLEMISNGSSSGKAFNFNLLDSSGKMRRMDEFSGKIVLMDFWYTGCGNCAEFYKNDLSKVEEQFKGNDTVIFISVNIDKNINTWKTSLKSGIYTSSHTVNLYTNSLGANHKIIKYYNVIAYPTILLFDKRGYLSSSDQIILRNKDTLHKRIKNALN